MSPLFTRVLHLIACAGLALNAFHAAAQCNNPPTLGNDTTICEGQFVMLTPGYGFQSYLWDNGSPAIFRSVTETGTYSCTVVTNVILENAVVNGDFAAGVSGFTSDYVPGFGGTWGELSEEGTYAVTTNAQSVHTNFSPCSDHSGTGQMLVVNGSAQDNISIWCQTVTVQPNTQYSFSAWLTSVTPSNPAVLQFTIDGVLLGTPFTATGADCTWNEFHELWTSGSATTVDLCITNQNTSEDGNDFALDDITLSPYCTYTVDIDVAVLPHPQISLGPDTMICQGESITLDATTPGATDYLWPDGSTSPTFTASDSGTVWVQVSNGPCMSTDEIHIGHPDCGVIIAIPNVFSPNSDGSNNTFTPIALSGIRHLDLSVFNRWGQEVFSSSSQQFGWTGRNVGGGTVPEGVYYWTLAYTSLLGEEGEQHGAVTVLR